MNSGTECTLSKLIDDTKLRGVVDRLDDNATIQRDLSWLEKFADKNRMKFNKGDCQRR